MKIFICNRKVDSTESKRIIQELISVSGNRIAILQETEHSDEWKFKVEQKMIEVDFVLFILGSNTFDSEALKWEYSKAKQLNKQIIGIKLKSASEDSVLFCQGFQVFENSNQCLPYLEKTFEDNRQLLLEQYKIMVGSTEKVTDQRLRVNNLFFTVTSSILSISVVFGKALDFSWVSGIGMLALGSMAFLVTFLWEKLIRSYGKLNTGKFIVIDQIEKQLRTNMFEYEWKILKEKLKYESNTDTEAKVVRRFRYFVILVIIFEIIYVLSKMNLLCLKFIN